MGLAGVTKSTVAYNPVSVLFLSKTVNVPLYLVEEDNPVTLASNITVLPPHCPKKSPLLTPLRTTLIYIFPL